MSTEELPPAPRQISTASCRKPRYLVASETKLVRVVKQWIRDEVCNRALSSKCQISCQQVIRETEPRIRCWVFVCWFVCFHFI